MCREFLVDESQLLGITFPVQHCNTNLRIHCGTFFFQAIVMANKMVFPCVRQDEWIIPFIPKMLRISLSHRRQTKINGNQTKTKHIFYSKLFIDLLGLLHPSCSPKYKLNNWSSQNLICTLKVETFAITPIFFVFTLKKVSNRENVHFEVTLETFCQLIQNAKITKVRTKIGKLDQNLIRSRKFIPL